MERVTKAQLAGALVSASAVAVGFAYLRRRRRTRQATVTQLVVYPVKSCRGIALEKAELDAGGIVHDREWMIVRAPTTGSDDSFAGMLTIRDIPRLATIQPMFTSSGKLMLCTEDGKSIVVEGNTSGVEYSSRVWRTQVTGIDQGDAVADFLTAFLECFDKPVRLIRMPVAERRLAECRKYSPASAGHEDQGGSSRFSDWTQLSIISNQTLNWLNTKETISGGMTNARFRMNIVVDAAEAFAEDDWQSFSVGDVGFAFLKHCGRCTVPNVDPNTGTKSTKSEPLKTLNRLRRGEYPFLAAGTDIQAFLGVNVRHFYNPGQSISVGDRVVVHKQRGSWFDIATMMHKPAAKQSPYSAGDAQKDSAWSGTSIGNAKGSVSVNNETGAILMTSTGRDIWSHSEPVHDEFFFARRTQQTKSSSSSYRCRVLRAGLPKTHFFLKAGINIRESLAPGARQVSICATSDRGPDRTPTVVFIWRSETNGECQFKAADFVVPNGIWESKEAKEVGMKQPGFKCIYPVQLRLDRKEHDWFVGYIRDPDVAAEDDDTCWHEVGKVQFKEFGPGEVGLALTKGFYTPSDVEFGEATFSEVFGF